uniref:Multidrug resistance protein MdtG n=1 Tax=Candidatus Methanogaster sp. ANME-2c ERB4 TaxID=2759911 RepID=A0A7G9YEL5_9EURY|nr:multidrug resistance protein MdtG [Methanosarcinales archaeon ANME-2c ERB4]
MNKLWARNKLCNIAISAFFVEFGTGMLMVLIPLYIQDLPAGMGLSLEIKSALVFSVFGLFAAVSYPVMGRLSDRLDSRKPFVLAGFAGFAVLAVACAEINTFEQLLIVRAAQGIMVGAMVPAILAMLAQVSTQDSRGRSIGIYSTIRGIGPAVGPAAGGIIAGALGYGAGFYACAALGLVSILLVKILVKETHETRGGNLGKDTTDRTSNGEIKLFVYATFTTMLAIMIVATLLPVYELHLDASIGGLGISLSAYFSARLFFQTPIGILSDRIGKRNLVAAGLCTTALLLLGMAHVTSVPQLFTLMFVAGITSSAVNVPSLASGADLASPGMIGRQMSLFPMASAIGMVIGPMLAGIFATQFGFAAPFYICAGLMVAVGVLIMRQR